MNNNRKRTKGRLIQAIKVPTNVIRYGEVVLNKHKNAGGIIQVKHRPIRLTLKTPLPTYG